MKNYLLKSLAYGKGHSVRLTVGLDEDIRFNNRPLRSSLFHRKESPFDDDDCICLKFGTAFLHTIDIFVISITHMPIFINLMYLLIELGFDATYKS